MPRAGRGADSTSVHSASAPQTSLPWTRAVMAKRGPGAAPSKRHTPGTPQFVPASPRAGGRERCAPSASVMVTMSVDLDLQLADQTAPGVRVGLRALLDVGGRAGNGKEELVQQLLPG